MTFEDLQFKEWTLMDKLAGYYARVRFNETIELSVINHFTYFTYLIFQLNPKSYTWEIIDRNDNCTKEIINNVLKKLENQNNEITSQRD